MKLPPSSVAAATAGAACRLISVVPSGGMLVPGIGTPFTSTANAGGLFQYGAANAVAS